jgi:hypothetical protein
MSIPVNFDGQSCLSAEKIDDVRPDPILAAKLQPVELPCPELRPK